MNFHKDYHSKIFFLTALGLLIYIFYRSEFFWDGNKRDYYKIYYFLSIIGLIFSLISFLIKKKNKIIYIYYFY